MAGFSLKEAWNKLDGKLVHRETRLIDTSCLRSSSEHIICIWYVVGSRNSQRVVEEATEILAAVAYGTDGRHTMAQNPSDRIRSDGP